MTTPSDAQSLSPSARQTFAAQTLALLRGVLAPAGLHFARCLDDADILAQLAGAGLRAAFPAAAVAGHGILWLELSPGSSDAEIRERILSQNPVTDLSTSVPSLFWLALIPGVGAIPLAATAEQLVSRVTLARRLVANPSAADSFPAPASAEAAAPFGGPLAGKVALVTGATSGIGLATARRLLAEGACVTLTGVTPHKLSAIARTLEAEGLGGRTQCLLCDVNDETSVVAAFEAVALQWGGLDILVNNAGLSVGKPLLETSVADYDVQNSVMPRGSFLCSREAARIFARQDIGGDIVYIVSKNALFAGPNNVAYGTAKAAQLHQARLLAAELAPLRVRVNAINPDAVVQGSGIFSSGWGADRARAYGINEADLGKFYATRSLLKQEVLPQDIAAAVFVLVGPELRKSTGLVINVDGGFPPSMLR
jgi:NAD(P)-dependent dehydrogenase (short-subunit alcohol dehydrogenase family)